MQQDEPIDLSINSKKVDVSFKGTDFYDFDKRSFSATVITVDFSDAAHSRDTVPRDAAKTREPTGKNGDAAQANQEPEN